MNTIYILLPSVVTECLVWLIKNTVFIKFDSKVAQFIKYVVCINL